MLRRSRRAPLTLVCSLLALTSLAPLGCRSRTTSEAAKKESPATTGLPTAEGAQTPEPVLEAPRPAAAVPNPLPGMPPVIDATNLNSEAAAGKLAPEAARALPRVYVPNSEDGTVSVIDSATYRVIETFTVGKHPQHVVPSWDLKTLWVANNHGDSLTPIDPTTGQPGAPVAVDDPYNMYFTPDGKYAVVVAEELMRLDFRDAQTMALVTSLPVTCKGVDHMDFTIDGRYGFGTCEFSGELVKVDVEARKVVGYMTLDPDGLGKKAMPQDIRFSPDGKLAFVADMMADGVYVIDAASFTRVGFVTTGKGAHGIYPSRDGRLFYVTNRGCGHVYGCKRGPGSISVVDPASLAVVANWPVPEGGSPDMGNVSADGRELWLSGRYDREVYVFDTGTGALTHRIPVGRGPHGLTVWPQPGRYSLGHTGNMR